MSLHILPARLLAILKHYKLTESFEEDYSGTDTLFGWGDMNRIQKCRDSLF
jgi:hypothetical protein